MIQEYDESIEQQMCAFYESLSEKDRRRIAEGTQQSRPINLDMGASLTYPGYSIVAIELSDVD